MNIRILEGSLHRIDLRTRMPFRYGIATMTQMPQVFVRLVCEIDGKRQEGISSDLLPPKWFTKVPDKDPAAEIEEMLQVIRQAQNFSLGKSASTPFDLWLGLEHAQETWAKEQRLPHLLAHFGTSLVERALLDAVCRSAHQPFATLLRNNAFGIRLSELHPELEDQSPSGLLPLRPLDSVTARHTVGLTDPLTIAEIPSHQRIPDGLPQALEECIRVYGLRHFKLKLGGNTEADLERLRNISQVLHPLAPTDYAFSLDGNEQFKSIDAFRSFWESLEGEESLKEFRRHLYFVEQPLHRDHALGDAVEKGFSDWTGHPPVIIDESDGDLASLPRALALGYAGTSHKNCKGVFKSIINRCLLSFRSKTRPDRPWMMSGEDLCNQGPIALLQDLAVMGALGIESVERNGHHYVAGLSAYPAEIQQQLLKHHRDLYHTTDQGWPSLTIEGGRISLASINHAPFGNDFILECGRWPDISRVQT